METVEVFNTIRLAANLTPDEKQGMLFDLSCSLKIPIEDFDEY